jgi:hypothetical protein
LNPAGLYNLHQNAFKQVLFTMIYLSLHPHRLNLKNHHHPTLQSDLLCENHYHQNSPQDQNPAVIDVLVQQALPCAFWGLVQLKREHIRQLI